MSKLDDSVTLADAARMLRMSYNGIKNQVLNKELIPDFIVPNAKGSGCIYRFKRETIENLIKEPPENLVKTRHLYKKQIEELYSRVEKLEQLIKERK